MQSITYNLNLCDVLKNENNYFNIKKYTYNNNEYTIIKYNKEKLKELEQNADMQNYNFLRKYRSVILRNNKVVVFSPEKSINYEKFINTYELNQCYVEDFIDGTMINVFYDNVNEIWEIATKSTVGGNIIFFNDIKNYQYFNKDYNYSNLTFRSMFLEACSVNNFKLEYLDKKYCYTFVMQHPFNRIVTPIVQPLIYLIKVYKINHNLANCLSVENLYDVTINEINIHELYNSPPYIFLNTNVKFVNKYLTNTFNINNYEELKNYYTGINAPYYCVGCMIYSNDGIRTKIRNNNYEMVRKLRGNQPKLQYNYLCLKQENKVKDFLFYYPEHSVIFNKFKLMTYAYTNELFMNYISCFIRKEKQLKAYDFQYKNHMYKLHEKYKTELKPNNKIIDKKFVIDYFNQLHPAQQMFVINYKLSQETVVNNEVNEVNMEVETSNNETFIMVN